MQNSTAKALWFIQPGHSIIRDTVLPTMDEGTVKIRSNYSAISPGTERLVFQGLVPPSLKSEMKVPYMEGDFSFPIKYGYSLVGEVIEGDSSHLGKKVHVMHPHQDIAVVNYVDIQVIPESIPSTRATLISNTETCVNAIWDSGVTIGDKVAIVGFGTIGSLLAMILQNMNFVSIDVVDINEDKLKKANNLGFTSLTPDQVENDSYDMSFHTSASGQGLQTAIDIVGKECNIIELSWYGTSSIHLNLGTSFHINRKKIISSQVSSIPGSRQYRWDYNRRKQLVLDILQNPDFDQLITSIVQFSDIGTDFEYLCAKDNNNLSLLVDYS